MQLSKNDILYLDEHIIAVNKPVDLPIHKNEFMAADADYLTKLIGQHTDKPVFPVHRLDSKTSGVIVLTFNRELASVLTKQFEDRSVKKEYLAIVQGDPGKGTFDNPVLIKKKKKRVDATTHYNTLKCISTNIACKGVEDVEIALVQLKPETGRWHQIRQHLSQQRFDILGDTQHGNWSLNRIMTELTDLKRLFLHAQKLSFSHPVTQEQMTIETEVPPVFEQLLEALNGATWQGGDL